MKPFRLLPLAAILAAVPFASAAVSFGYGYSDTRTLLTNDDVHYSPYGPVWSGTLAKDAGDPDVYLNGIEAVPGAGFDPNLFFGSPYGGLEFYDALNGPGLYSFGTPISGAADWQIREIFSVYDYWENEAPAPGLYDIAVTLRGGADAGAWDDLATFDLHVEVAERFDVSVSTTATPISGPDGTSRITLTATNHMDRDFLVLSPFLFKEGFTTSEDPNATLSGDHLTDWENKTLTPGETYVGAHSDWKLNSSSVVGDYTGTVGLAGGFHYGDLYYLEADPITTIAVQPMLQAVPEPAPLAALAVGALVLRRRRRR